MTTESEYERIIMIEDNLLTGSRTSDTIKRTHSCKFCERTFSWADNMTHDEYCPITLMAKIRQEKGIPNWMERTVLKNKGS